MTMHLRSLTLAIAAIVSSAITAHAAGTIDISGVAEVRHGQIRLGDVARLRGFDRETASRLASVDLGPAPVVGTGRLLPRAFLKSALDAAEVPPATRIRLPERLEVSRASEILSGRLISQEVEAKLRTALPAGVELASVRVPLLSDLKVPAGAAREIRIEGPVDPQAPVVVDVIVRDGDALVRSQRVSVRLETVTSVLVAADELQRGQTVGRAEVRALRLPEGQVPDDAIRSLDEVDGGSLRRALKAGEPLTRRVVELPPLVRRGERVTLLAEAAGMRLTAVGEALGTARRGDTVKVRNIDSQKVVAGRVSGPQTVSMEF